MDRHGNLWVSSRKGLQKLPVGAEEFVQIASQTKDLDGIAEDGVKHIFEAHDGKIWLGLSRNGTALLDPITYSTYRISLDTQKPMC